MFKGWNHLPKFDPIKASLETATDTKKCFVTKDEAFSNILEENARVNKQFSKTYKILRRAYSHEEETVTVRIK